MRQLRLMFQVPDFVKRYITAVAALILITLLTAPAFAQMPTDLQGQWSDSQTSCTGNQDEGVTVFDIGPNDISWYEISCDIRNVRPNADGAFLRVDCEKGGGARGSGDIDIRRLSPHSLDVYVSPLGFSTELHYQLKRCQTSGGTRPPGSPPPSYWNHNGSTVYLLANGAVREFYYDRPRPGMLEAGARPGSLLFSGEAAGNTYDGTAYIFNRRCGSIGYHVSGPILDNYRRVVLRGQAPRVDRNCRVMDYMTDTLEFELIGR